MNMNEKKLRLHVCVICRKEFFSAGNSRVCSKVCARERKRLWDKNHRAGNQVKKEFLGVDMSQALDDRGCELVKDFFVKLVRAADMAKKYRLPVNTDVISNLMSMYRAREI